MLGTQPGARGQHNRGFGIPHAARSPAPACPKTRICMPAALLRCSLLDNKIFHAKGVLHMFAGIANCSGVQDIFYSLDNTSVLAGSGTLTGKGVFLTPQGSFVGSGRVPLTWPIAEVHEKRQCRHAQPGSEGDIMSWVCRCICGRPGIVLISWNAQPHSHQTACFALQVQRQSLCQ